MDPSKLKAISLAQAPMSIIRVKLTISMNQLILLLSHQILDVNLKLCD
jgi:hypothetical protein